MVYDAIVRALFAEVCPGCGHATREGFCEVCAARFEPVANPCRACALARPVAICPRSGGFWRLTSVVAPFAYGAPLDRYIHALKYRGARTLGRALGLLLAERLRAEPLRADAVVAVPLHPRRLRERGYNQAAEIARTLARRLGLPLLSSAAHRSADRTSQISLDARERYANTVNAFVATRPLAGLRLAIVDDVITTGATVNALAAALAAAGASHVEAWAVARTAQQSSSG